MSNIQYLRTHIPAQMAGKRLDQVLAELFPDYSRARLQLWVKQGQVVVDAVPWRSRDKVLGGEYVEITAETPQQTRWEAQAITLDVVYEDDALLVINKPAGLVVHPGAGNSEGTLLNALLHHAPELGQVPRAGIVHRLDKDTSGLLVIARSLTAQKHLVEQLQARSLEREYDAVVVGVMTAGGRVDLPLGRHPVERTRMAITTSTQGKPAITHFRVAERFRAHTHVKVRLETGRTHQIRVHMAHLRFPVVGDPVYGGRLRLPRAASAELMENLRGFRRQALHAAALGLVHPGHGELMRWSMPPPADILELLALLRDDAEQSGNAA